MANVWASALAVVGIVIMLTSLLTWTAYMLPRPVARAQRRIENHPWQSFFVGLAVIGVGAVAFYLALTIRPMISSHLDVLLEMLTKFAGVARYTGDSITLGRYVIYISIIPFAIAIIIGSAAFARLFAQRADSLGDRPVSSLVGGAFVYSTSMFLPLVGWFVFLPIVAAMSAGAGMLSLLSREPAPTNG